MRFQMSDLGVPGGTVAPGTKIRQMTAMMTIGARMPTITSSQTGTVSFTVKGKLSTTCQNTAHAHTRMERRETEQNEMADIRNVAIIERKGPLVRGDVAEDITNGAECDEDEPVEAIREVDNPSYPLSPPRGWPREIDVGHDSAVKCGSRRKGTTVVDERTVQIVGHWRREVGPGSDAGVVAGSDGMVKEVKPQREGVLMVLGCGGLGQEGKGAQHTTEVRDATLRENLANPDGITAV